ncbi:MAG: adenosylcobinamide-GDP ribazoletransferase [Oscillospiraceae bacterium]|nr:adenosylcobinamide-GDP ribazoletransferase [Oscillospiraceae bacterium]
MTVLQTIAVAFSMFSAVPMPQFAWSRENMRYALLAFPLIGLLIGGVCALWAGVCQWLSLPALLRGVGLCLIPVGLTGGIHLDGACDTWDALASHAAPERKREILKDPHIGSFAAIRLGAYFLISFALWAVLPEFRAIPLLLSFCLSRSLSGLAVTVFPLASDTGLAHTFAAAADRRRVGIALAVLSGALCLALCLSGVEGIAMAVAALAVLGWYRGVLLRQFGGLSGDLAGWFLQMAELWMLLALVGVQLLEVRFG